MKMNKKDRALELYRVNHTMPRKELIDLFMKELPTTENSARTHINNASKVLNTQLGKAYHSRNTAKPTLKKERAKQIILSNYMNMTRSDLANKILSELGLKSLSSAQTHISRIMKEAGVVTP